MLHQYILRQALWPLVATVTALGLLALLTQSISTLDLIIDQRQSVWVYLEITLLALPQLLALILPLALFVTALYAMNRLQNDSELVVCSAAGMSRWRIASPLIKLALTAAVANLAINAFVQPSTFRYMRERLYEVRSDLAARFVRPGEFRSPTEGLTIYARDLEPGGRLIDLFIEDATDPMNTVVYSAQSGVFTEVGGEPALVMNDGSVHSMDADRAMNHLEFDSYPLVLSSIIDSPGVLFYKLSDRYLHELLFPDPFEMWSWRHGAKLYAEGHYRLSAPLFNIALVLIALAAILGGEFARKGYFRRIAAACCLAITVRLIGFAAQSAAAGDPRLNVLQYAVPITAGGIALAMILVRRRKRSRPAPFAFSPTTGAPPTVAPTGARAPVGAAAE